MPTTNDPSPDRSSQDARNLSAAKPVLKPRDRGRLPSFPPQAALLFAIALLIPLLGAPPTARAGSALKSYWTLEEFYSSHPEQAQITQQFAQRVQRPAQPVTTRQERALRISVVYPGEQLSDYWRRNIVAFELRLQELGIEYRLQSHFSKPLLDAREQAQQIQAALRDSPDYLIFTLDTTRHRKLIERIRNREETKLILQNITTPLRDWDGNQPFFYVGFDHIRGTRMLADYFTQRSRQGADFALLYFTQGYVSTARGDTFIDMLAPFQQIRLRTSYFTQANRSSAHEASLSALADFPQLDFIYACSTDVALGAIDALRETGRLGEVVVNGWGGGSSELEAIARGEMEVTVMRMNDDTGVAMAEAIALDLQEQPVPRVYSGEFALVTRSTSKAELEHLKARAFRYSSSLDALGHND